MCSVMKGSIYGLPENHSKEQKLPLGPGGFF